jgi:hypothetical protein
MQFKILSVEVILLVSWLQLIVFTWYADAIFPSKLIIEGNGFSFFSKTWKLRVQTSVVVLWVRDQKNGNKDKKNNDRCTSIARCAKKNKKSSESSQNFRESVIGKANSTRSFGSTPVYPFEFHHVQPPKRDMYVLSGTIIGIVIRVLWFLHYEQITQTVSTTYIFKRCSEYLDIGQTKLRQLWDDWIAVKGKELPLSHVHAMRKERIHVLGSEWCGTLRMEIMEMRMNKSGHAVEIPDILKMLREKYNIYITKGMLRYRLKKMGFLFGKVRKYCLCREGENVTHKRRVYLSKRMEYKNILEAAQYLTYLCR